MMDVESVLVFLAGVGITIQIGHVLLRPLVDGSYWIENGEGEGMQVSADAIERLLTDFLEENI